MKPSLPSIFDYSDLSQFLESYSSAMKSRDEAWTLAQWAKDIGLSSTAALTRVINGDRSPDYRVYRALGEFFSFAELEAEYFKLLVVKARARGDQVISMILEDRFWPIGRNGNEPSMKLVSGFKAEKKPISTHILQINRGRLLSLEGLGRKDFVDQYLSPMGLISVSGGEGVPVGVNFCQYDETSIGPFQEFYISVLAMPKNGHIGQVGFIFVGVCSDQKTACDLGKIVWGIDCRPARIESAFGGGPSQDRVFSIASDRRELSVSTNLSDERFQASSGDISFNGFSDLFGAVSLFRIDIEGTKLEKAFDRSSDRFEAAPGSVAGDFLSACAFEPAKWTLIPEMSCGMSGPFARVDRPAAFPTWK